MVKTGVSSVSYDQNYFENGVASGVSGYENYRWMPELTMRMAFHMINSLNIKPGESILDFGCAKGFLVKAFRLFDFDAYGCDISSYAISMVDKDIENHCWSINGCGDPRVFKKRYSWMISKDVFEHLKEDDLRVLMNSAKSHVDKMFLVIPLAANDADGKYIIPEYDKDVTHVLAKSSKWWINLFQETGWILSDFSHTFKGCKENWTEHWPTGNGFFIIENADLK